MTYILDPDSGRALPEKAVRLAEIIHDFNPDLEVRWIPPENVTKFDTKPFAIWHNYPKHPDGGYYVMHLSEDELDHRVLARLFKAQNASLDEIDAQNAAIQLMNLKKRMDEEEELQAFQKFVIQSNKTIRHNGVVYR